MKARTFEGKGGRRVRKGGRTGRVALFGGLVKDALSGSGFVSNCGTRSDLMEPNFKKNAKTDGPVSESFPVAVFELALVSRMSAINLQELLPLESGRKADEMENLTAERARVSVGDGSHEIAAVPELLRVLDL